MRPTTTYDRDAVDRERPGLRSCQQIQMIDLCGAPGNRAERRLRVRIAPCPCVGGSVVQVLSRSVALPLGRSIRRMDRSGCVGWARTGTSRLPWFVVEAGRIRAGR